MSDAAVAYLSTPRAIRDRANELLQLGLEGKLLHFEVDLDRLGDVVARVVRVTRAAYPSLEIPPHGRLRHFVAGGVDRLRALDGLDREERLVALVDLIVTSVLLDAGAGAEWSYREGERSFARSEGLAVASFHAFAGGAFSSDPRRPLRADRAGLAAFDAAALGRAFQVGPQNPLEGLEGRAALVRRLGEVMASRPEVFGEGDARIGNLTRVLFERARDGAIGAPAILALVLDAFRPIWPSRHHIDGTALGDVWPHPLAGGPGRAKGFVPFHKLSQWLTYSLIEPLEQAGLRVTELDDLTGLAEYRNGGLFVDSGVLTLARRTHAEPFAADATEIVEWRALTVALLDRVAVEVRRELGAPLALARILEGGTWAAGREIANEKRARGVPPIAIASDGTVF
jgi:hypothetical protein